MDTHTEQPHASPVSMIIKREHETETNRNDENNNDEFVNTLNPPIPSVEKQIGNNMYNATTPQREVFLVPFQGEYIQCVVKEGKNVNGMNPGADDGKKKRKYTRDQLKGKNKPWLKNRILELLEENETVQEESAVRWRENKSLRDTIDVLKTTFEEEKSKLVNLEKNLVEVKKQLKQCETKQNQNQFDELLEELDQSRAEIDTMKQVNKGLNEQRIKLFKYAENLTKLGNAATVRLRQYTWQHGYVMNNSYNDRFDCLPIVGWDGKCDQCGSGQPHMKTDCLARGFACHGCNGNHFTTVCKTLLDIDLSATPEEKDLMASITAAIANSQ